jgi:hypothetical protein
MDSALYGKLEAEETEDGTREGEGRDRKAARRRDGGCFAVRATGEPEGVRNVSYAYAART